MSDHEFVEDARAVERDLVKLKPYLKNELAL
jgi:hypothetical protein